MLSQNIYILIANDDLGDCLHFKKIIEELPISGHLAILHYSEQLIGEFKKPKNKLPDYLALGTTTPRKSGIASFGERKHNTGLQELPVVIICPSSEPASDQKVFWGTANCCVLKPVNYSQPQKMI